MNPGSRKAKPNQSRSLVARVWYCQIRTRKVNLVFSSPEFLPVSAYAPPPAAAPQSQVVYFLPNRKKGCHLFEGGYSSRCRRKVADFGLAKFSSYANTHVSTRVIRTFRYLVPEYDSS